MVSSAYVGILYKVAELAQRFGLRASDAEADLIYVSEEDDPKGAGFSCLRFSSAPTDPQKSHQFGKMIELLGVGDDSLVKADDFMDIEDIVDRALTLAPRSRAR